jgi:hypothetical protein
VKKPEIEEIEKYEFSSYDQAIALMGFELIARNVPIDPPIRVGEAVPVIGHYETEVLELKPFAAGYKRFWKYVKREARQ